MDFVAIDFETATADHTSACAVGVVVVKRSKIIDRFSSLICPSCLDFSQWNVRVHGITPEAVKGKPSFQDLWPKLSRFVDGNVLIAHNAPFDMHVLYRCLEAANTPWEARKYACTLAMARRLLPGLQNHRLGTLAALFGIELDHHDAASDAAACAEIAIRLGRLGCEPAALDCFMQEFEVSHSQVVETFGNSTSSVTVSLNEELARLLVRDDDDEAPDQNDSEKEHPIDAKDFSGMKFVFTGDLATLKREKAEAIVQQRHGETSGSVSKKTDYVVVGPKEMDAYKASGHTTTKFAKALALKANGEKVEVIGEAEFLAMIR